MLCIDLCYRYYISICLVWAELSTELICIAISFLTEPWISFFRSCRILTTRGMQWAVDSCSSSAVSPFFTGHNIKAYADIMCMHVSHIIISSAIILLPVNNTLLSSLSLSFHFLPFCWGWQWVTRWHFQCDFTKQWLTIDSLFYAYKYRNFLSPPFPSRPFEL